MADIEIQFVHPNEERLVRASLDDAMTASEVVADLTAAGFLPSTSLGYCLAEVGGLELEPTQPLSAAGIKSGSILRLISVTEAGGPDGGGGTPGDERGVKGDKAIGSIGIGVGATVHKTTIRKAERAQGDSSIPGVARRSRDRLTLQDIQRSPEAVALLVHLYDTLLREHRDQAALLRVETTRSSNRFTAALILLVSQVVLGVGGNLLTANRSVAVLVLSCGGLMALLALWLSFSPSRGLRRSL